MKHSWDRPKLHIPKTKSEKVFDWIGYTFFIGSLIFLIVVWKKLPAQVPGQYNVFGEVERWGAKTELFIMPIVGAFTAFVMQVLEKFPEAHNYPKRFNEANAAQFYLASRKLVNQLKNSCFIIFALITFESVTVSLGGANMIGPWLLPFILVATLLPIVVAIVRLRAIK